MRTVIMSAIVLVLLGGFTGAVVGWGSPTLVTAKPKCAGQPVGAACWMELANQPECYVWNNGLQPDQTVTWTAGCAEGLAQGMGTLTWVWDRGTKTQETIGRLLEGKRHGQWVFRDKDGGVAEGSYVEGRRHGHWVYRTAGGRVQEGPYVEGKRHGRWVENYIFTLDPWCGWCVAEGSYVEGKRHGRWVSRVEDTGALHGKGSFVEGKKHGRWVEHYGRTIREYN